MAMAESAIDRWPIKLLGAQTNAFSAIRETRWSISLTRSGLPDSMPGSTELSQNKSSCIF